MVWANGSGPGDDGNVCMRRLSRELKVRGVNSGDTEQEQREAVCLRRPVWGGGAPKDGYTQRRSE